jgi:hypothetical protein
LRGVISCVSEIIKDAVNVVSPVSGLIVTRVCSVASCPLEDITINPTSKVTSKDFILSSLSVMLMKNLNSTLNRNATSIFAEERFLESLNGVD